MAWLHGLILFTLILCAAGFVIALCRGELGRRGPAPEIGPPSPGAHATDLRS